MSSGLQFSVIIPTCHRNDALAACLERLAPGRQTLAADRYEVIVTDDGSSTTAETMVREKFPWAKWTVGPRRGPAANRNHGVRLAHAAWLAFTDDDCLPDAHWLDTYVRAVAANPQTRVFDGFVYAERPKRSLGETSPTKNAGGQLWACNFAIQRALYERLGGFDERFPYAAMEDCDLALRLKQAGEPTLFVREASLCHPWRPKVGWAGHKRHQVSHWIYLELHPAERASIRPGFFLEASARTMVKETLPGIFKYAGRGFGKAMLEHAFWLQTAWLLLLRKAKSPDAMLQSGPEKISAKPSLGSAAHKTIS
ncbi:MAG: glycosyltransferase [Verrucomicrobia bacterium]|nr:glycosyltransferase [Verrucomicrobiota bacterium]